ncbi:MULTISPECIES: hypothetical protein [unclassified Bosea (in: a-proteobacteria)]|uniref:hypothetical protein n=1 Tax=unclassified Bosea (in: a-proteobacteria) TaxID=2653178 RepID=UPI000F7F3A1A|nr:MULTISPECIES: hypothetical protein [unclassified Bosea (in: a-proteobacteria)]
MQIDENWKNYGFKQLIPLSVHVAAGSNFTANTYSVSVAGEAILIAPVTSNLAVTVLRTEYVGGVWTFYLLIMRQFILSFDEFETAQIYVFDIIPPAPFSNVGLEVFNALGERTFHSDMNPLKARAVLPGSVGFGGPSDRVYAPLALTHTRHFDPISGIQYWGLRRSGSTIFPTQYNIPGGGFFGVSVNDGLYAAVDVTGL